MSDELKACPKCGTTSVQLIYWRGKTGRCFYSCRYCYMTTENADSEEEARRYWNEQPYVDALRAERDRLASLLMDERSQLEIATDLGNKRWIALNDIYENGEKHNANWCKRKVMEGLGVKNG